MTIMLNRKKKTAWILCLVLFVLLAGCEQKKTQTSMEATSVEAVSVEDDSTQTVETNNEVGNATNTSIEKSDVPAEAFDISSLVGSFCYDTPDEVEDTIFQIREIENNLYIEYLGPYAYAGAEIEVIAYTEEENKTTVSVKMYPFSTFSFMGEYWGAGACCNIIVYDNGDLELTKGQPFLTDDSIYLSLSKESYIHESELDASKSSYCDELIGCWKASFEESDSQCETYLEFAVDGHFYLLTKKADYTPSLYIGKYEADWVEAGLLGNIECEMFAGGTMPYEFLVRYDEELECPIIIEGGSYFEADSFTPDSALPYQKVNSKECYGITLGPGARTSKVEELYAQYK